VSERAEGTDDTAPAHRVGPDSVGMADVLGEVQRRVSYLRAELAVPTADAASWIDCENVPADPVALDTAIDAGAATRGGGDRQVAASLLVQSYAFKVAAPALAAYAIGAPPLPVRAAHLAVALSNGRASGLAYRSNRLGPPDDCGALAEALLADHLEPLVAAVRERVRIGERLLWGNIAASCAAAFRAAEGAARDQADHVERAAVRRRAERFFAAASPWLDGLGTFERVEVGDRDGWFWTRTSCCLWFRVAERGATCDDCSLIATATLLANRRAELAGTPA